MSATFWVATLALGFSPGAAEAKEATAAAIVSAFQAVCGTGEASQAAELARAEALGWRRTGPAAPPGLPPLGNRLSPASGPALVLTTAANPAPDETLDTCGVSSAAPVNGLAEAVQAWLGFAPNFAAYGSATFISLRSGDTWRASPKLAPPALAEAKRVGALYSIMVLNNGPIPSGDGFSTTLAFFRTRKTS